jgi:hypothetical protein
MIVIALLIIILVVIIGSGALGLKLGYSDGWEARGLHEQNQRNMRRLEEGRAERAARTLPAIDWDGWAASLNAPRERLASTGELRLALGEHIGPAGAAAVLSDTGALKALTENTDAYLERMAAEESAYREGLTS